LERKEASTNNKAKQFNAEQQKATRFGGLQSLLGLLGVQGGSAPEPSSLHGFSKYVRDIKEKKAHQSMRAFSGARAPPPRAQHLEISLGF